MATTPNRGYQLPAPGSKLKDDVLRLIAALGAIDTDVANLLLALAGKSDLGHGHAMAEITGLVAALGNKLDVGYHDALANLTDVDVAGVANGMALLRQASKWIPVALQINNIAGLETALSSKATPADIAAAINALVAAAPGALDTLNELASALGNDANFAATMSAALGLRVRVDAAQAHTAAQQGQARANIGASFLAGYRNKLLNSSFVVQSRAGGSALNVPAGTTVWVADCWRLYNGTDVAVSVLVRYVDGSHFFGYSPPAGILVQPTSAPTTGIVAIFQDTEDLRTVQGSATVSCLASLSIPVVAGIERYFFSGAAAVSQSTATLNAVGWGRSANIPLPSIPLATPSTGSFLRTFLQWSPRTTEAVEFSRISLVAGDATAERDALLSFDERPKGVEERDAQRYFRRALEGLSLSFVPGYGNARWIAVEKQHPVPMYSTPTATLGSYTESLTNMSPGGPDVNWSLGATALNNREYTLSLGGGVSPPTSGNYLYAQRNVTYTADIAI